MPARNDSAVSNLLFGGSIFALYPLNLFDFQIQRSEVAETLFKLHVFSHD